MSELYFSIEGDTLYAIKTILENIWPLLWKLEITRYPKSTQIRLKTEMGEAVLHLTKSETETWIRARYEKGLTTFFKRFEE